MRSSYSSRNEGAKKAGLAALGAGVFILVLYGVAKSSAGVLSTPIRKVDPLNGECVAVLDQGFVRHCSQYTSDLPEETTFPGTTFEQLFRLSQQ